LLAIAFAIVPLGYVYLSVSGGRFLTVSAFARFSITVVKLLGHLNESGPSRGISLLKPALSSPQADGSIEIDGQVFSFPLPKYAVPRDQGVGRYYFVAFVTPDEMDNYFYRELPRAGWTQVDQMGAAHLLEGHNAHMTIVQHFYLTSDISDFNVSLKDRP
jgi:hypothetical protein